MMARRQQLESKIVRDLPTWVVTKCPEWFRPPLAGLSFAAHTKGEARAKIKAMLAGSSGRPDDEGLRPGVVLEKFG
jgi:hypothetical protein